MFHRSRHAWVRCSFIRHLSRHRAAPVTVTVYLSTHPHSMLHGYRPGDTMVLADRFLLHKSEPRAGDDALLERIFDALNDHPHPADAQHSRRWYRRGNRSLSVGDVVAVEDRDYACAAIGWRRVPHHAEYWHHAEHTQEHPPAALEQQPLPPVDRSRSWHVGVRAARGIAAVAQSGDLCRTVRDRHIASMLAFRLTHRPCGHPYVQLTPQAATFHLPSPLPPFLRF
ncbi:hypothetical protein AB0I35_31460 [Nocardia sp. NPDC050378]|uniref:hypothetical protein n=1 Tax=Nocardia sp. NPDC050378 TaxID=3155400 RepID=UPI0033F1891F